MKYLVAILLTTLLLLVPRTAFADVGVGVGNGKIDVKEKLKPGVIYKLPPLNVFNTGTVTSDYTVLVTFNEAQAQKKPDPSWFHFTPEKFTLQSGKSQKVTMSLQLPFSVFPGDYFAYIEARPLTQSPSGITTIGVAAASKLSFTVIPSNVFEAVYYRVLALFITYAPWSYIIVAALLATLIIWLLSKKINLSIGVKKK